MPLTRDVKETIRARIKRDPEFGEELLKEGIECLLAGEVGTGKILLRDYIDATIGFRELGELTAKRSSSLIHMFGPESNPQARNLLGVIGRLQEHKDLRIKVQVVQAA